MGQTLSGLLAGIIRCSAIRSKESNLSANIVLSFRIVPFLSVSPFTITYPLQKYNEYRLKHIYTIALFFQKHNLHSLNNVKVIKPERRFTPTLMTVRTHPIEVGKPIVFLALPSFVNPLVLQNLDHKKLSQLQSLNYT